MLWMGTGEGWGINDSLLVWNTHQFYWNQECLKPQKPPALETFTQYVRSLYPTIIFELVFSDSHLNVLDVTSHLIDWFWNQAIPLTMNRLSNNIEILLLKNDGCKLRTCDGSYQIASKGTERLGCNEFT